MGWDGQIPLAMESLSSAPDEDAGQDNEEGGPNHVLIISDCNGRCDFVSAHQSFFSSFFSSGNERDFI